jgi:hypothetical protein
MANVIKYIYTSVPANTVQTYPFVIGVNFGGYGSTAATGFWNGKTPNVGGYVVYVSVSPPSSPTLYVANNDTQLINLCNQLFGTGVSTIGAALQTFNGSTSTCCVNVDYSNIVTTNIGPNLDAGYTPSYPRIGTTWTDISGSGYTSTLVNGVSYGSDALTFDGTDDAVTLPSTITLGNGNWSVCMWVSAGSFNADYGKLLSNNSGGPVSNALGVTSGKISYQYYLTSWNQQLGNTSLSTGVWYFLTWVNSSPGQMLMYVNGVVDCALFTSTTNNGGPVNSIGRNWFSTFPGKISTVSIYQGKSLTPAEILQNYYAGLQRFIPTDGLVLQLDGNNTNTQVITPTTANDISGNNYNGTLVNGVTLSNEGQRSFLFDGIDDKITTSLTTLNSSSTWSIWIKRTQSMSFYNMFMSMGNPYFSFRSDGAVQFTVDIGGTPRDLVASLGLVDNVWYYFTFVSLYLGSTTIRFYLNGVLQVESTYAGQQLSTTGSGLTLGDWTIASYPFKGNLDDIRMYNRALTSSEINTIYTATKSRYGY